MNALELKGLTKHYGEFTLGPLDLTLPEGCVLGLVGENGAGKSTTIRLILNMIRADGGAVRVLGQERPEMEELGVVPDEPGISECLTPGQLGRVLERSFRSWDNRAWAELLRRLDLPENKRFKDFSRGMKMKLAIAAAMAHRPRLLILDEATSGLDPVVRDEVLEMFGEFTRDPGHSILISSHIVGDLERLCDYIAFLHKGKLLLFAEKDRLAEEYCVLRCAPEELRALPPGAVVGKKASPYGVEAVIRREAAPAGAVLGQIDLEQLFVFMVKGEEMR